VFDLSVRGVGPAAATLARCRRESAELGARWLDPYHCFVSADIAAQAGEWPDALAELDAGLEMAQEIGSGWISTAVGLRAYVDAHCGRLQEAGDRLRKFDELGLPRQFGSDEPGRAALAVLEMTPSPARAVELANELWLAAEGASASWMLDLAPDAARVALTGADVELGARIAAQVSALDVSGCPATAPVVDLVVGMSTGDADRIEHAATRFRDYGAQLPATRSWEESACAAAAAGDRDRARQRLELAVTGYEAMGAVRDLDRLLGRARNLGLRRGPRHKHRTAAVGPGSLTATELRIARLVQVGMTNPQIAAELWLSPRTVQTHVSHILAKLGLRSRNDLPGIRLPG
jgi:DNA-binding CsgD family transcriptional regulator